MCPIRDSEKFTELEINQMETIDELQEKIKLLEFDNTQNLRRVKELEKSLIRKKNTINNIIRELELMRKEEKYTRLLLVTNILKKMAKEGYDE